MNDNKENMQPASCGASSGDLSCLQELLKKDKQSLFVDNKAERRQSVGNAATCREVSGLHDLIKKHKQSPFVEDKAKKRQSIGISVTCREVSGLQHLLNQDKLENRQSPVNAATCREVSGHRICSHPSLLLRRVEVAGNSLLDFGRCQHCYALLCSALVESVINLYLTNQEWRLQKEDSA